jgi:hypothetical protein
MNPKLLTVYKSPFKKLRIGKDYDGGYIICDIPYIKYEVLISGGISDDISFENEFCNKFNTKCIAFDGTIDYNKFSNLNSNSNINFIAKNINFMNDDNTTNLNDYINEYNNIFIKMDIEGYEINWIKTLSEIQLNKISQIVIEFHFPFSNNEIDVFNKLNKNHVLIHFHGNNSCGVRLHEYTIIPNVFECTYIHKKYFESKLELNKDPIPSIIDMKNVIDKDEININYPPFVHKD